MKKIFLSDILLLKRINVKSVCLIFFLFYYSCHATQAQQNILKPRAYYLCAMGNDINPGTKNLPWKTISKINSSNLSPNDTILFEGGHIFKGTLQLHPGIEGSAKNPILITSYGKGKAIINSGNETAILLKKLKSITIKKLKILGAGRKDGNTGDGIALSECSNIIIHDVDVSGFRNAGISVYASSYIKIIKAYTHENGFAGISVSGLDSLKNSSNNIYIGYCKADNNPGSPVILDNHSGNGIIAGNCNKVTIEYCTATNNGWDMPRKGNGPVGIWCYEADSVIIQHCISYRNKTSAGSQDGGGFDLDGGVTNSTIQYCLSYENQGSGFGIFQYAGASPWNHNTIRYNISENDGNTIPEKAAVLIWNSTNDTTMFKECFFYNNTIYNSKGPAIAYATESLRTGFYFYNNIFVGYDSLINGKRLNDTFLANDWWSLKSKFNIEGEYNFKKWANSADQEKNENQIIGLNVKPFFKTSSPEKLTSVALLRKFNNYKISSMSSLRYLGINLHNLFKIDTGQLEFTGRIATLKGIGASF